ncbi:amino acid/amide ABC transporter substrate-binding protein, HAAT family [Haloarcula vallismortis]|uniref:Branched-chain/neutral amino acids amide ABC transporter periplasmic substrate-binding protein 1 n=2 Tax=Haloarcula vallismortis TaxID=28442 RepID=M0J1J5_HALVA|nr:ABC transporter substrate-binding protein [Haloarcula vallismortis]EMA01904.1 branched-chain/neutral amino acids amide ABC transporter periplasmic substrate-binding protein 1 [Haloarcula vallismortis ATCC 29715]SDW51372.1 amino acid/amide ABC transporter substrate-binding protein, HAAT family [Haloarcula vallismortis]
MSRDINRRAFLKRTGAISTVGLLGGLAGCSTEQTGGDGGDGGDGGMTGTGTESGGDSGPESPDVLMVVGYPQSGVQLFKDFYADYGDDAADILVTDGLQDGELPSNVGNDMSNVRGTAPSAAGPGVDTFTEQFTSEFDYDEAGVFTSQAYDATAVQILANLLAGENDGQAVRDHMRVVANPGGDTYGPSELPAAVEAAAAGENIQYEGASSAVDFDENGDMASAQYQVFGFQDGGGVDTLNTVDFSAGDDIPQPEPNGSGSDSGRTIRFGVLMPETGDLGPLGRPIRDGAILPALQLEGEVDFEFDYQVGDTQTQAQAGIDAANSLVSAGYPSITGAASSETSIQVARNVLIDNSVVGCSPASTSPTITDLEDNDYMFRTPPSDALQGQVLAQVGVDELGAETASTLYVNNSYGQALQEAFAGAFEAEGGTIVNQVGFEQQQSSYTSEINSAMNQ